MTRSAYAFSFVSDVIPIYGLYALLFVHAGLSPATISGLFALWSGTGLVCEVPTGALADRFSRRTTVVVAEVAKAAGFAVWALFPVLPGFAVGFMLWGGGGSLATGAFEALLYDGLAAAGASASYPRVYGRVRALNLIAQLPAALAGAGLYLLGGFALAGWASVGVCLLAAAVATRLPEVPRSDREGGDELGYFATLRSGVVEAMANPAVRIAVVAVASLAAVDVLEEYFPLMAHDWGVPTAWNPIAVVGIPVVGAVGAALAGRTGRLRAGYLPLLLLAGAALLGLAGLVARPAGLAAVAGFYALYQVVMVIVESRLQDRIDGARATVTSVAALLVEVMSFAFYAVWAVGGVLGSAVALLPVAAMVAAAHVPGRRRGRPRQADVDMTPNPDAAPDPVPRGSGVAELHAQVAVEDAGAE
ncbi:MAG TPA: MFS transporter [Micromonosporaceae bacterium]|nr:MFS transporter [Micromonosporaceae bacterium]